MNNPLVTLDAGPALAGKPDQCIYCSQKLGQPHKDDCPYVKKTVRVRMSFEIDVVVPRSWEDHDTEFFYGPDSSHCCCLENIASSMVCEGPSTEECLCDDCSCEVVK